MASKDNRCPFCEGALSPLYSLAPYFPHSVLMQCEDCSSCIASPGVSEEQVSKLYQGTYFSGSTTDHYKGNLLADYYAKISRPFLDALNRDDPILEAGPGFGYFANLLTKMGFTNITVCEPSAACGDFIRETLPSVRIEETLDALIRKGNRFKIIFAFHVLEHLTDPVSFFHDLRRLCADAGLFVALTPNASSSALENYRAGWGWACPNQHIVFLSERIPGNFYENCGFKILSSKSVTPSQIHYPSHLTSWIYGILNPYFRMEYPKGGIRWFFRGVLKRSVRLLANFFAPNVPKRPARRLEAFLNSLCRSPGKDELELVLRAK